MIPRSAFILRFDDICPSMNWSVWAEIENVLIDFGIKPIIAVVPDNRDPNLNFSGPVQDFWVRVRRWQTLGWAIAMHGYQHVYVNRNPGILGVNSNSEFAGLPRSLQEYKLKQALKIFQREDVRVDAWIAPSHSFDWTTIGLLKELDVNVISDGYAFYPYKDVYGMLWVPSQLSYLRNMPPGIWTFCQHHNEMTDELLKIFLVNLGKYRSRMISFSDACRIFGERKRNLADKLLSHVLYSKNCLRRRKQSKAYPLPTANILPVQ